MREAERGIASGVALDAIAENRLWEVFVELRENKLAFVYGGRLAKKAKCASVQRTIQIDFDLKWRKSMKIMELDAWPV